MTAQGEDILAWLDNAISVREKAARAAEALSPSPWMAGPNEDESVAHIALHDPESVLRRCAAERKLLELHAGKMHSCPAKDETGYLDEWTHFGHGDACPVVRLLAEGYGWTGGKR